MLAARNFSKHQHPPLEEDPYVGIATDGMGVLMLGILTEGKVDTTDIPQMETPDETVNMVLVLWH
jgi:hypothetical protein